MEPNVVPVIVTAAPTAPVVIDKLVIAGVTVKFTPLLATFETLTTTFPVVAPLGTVTVMLVDPHVDTVAVVPLNLTVLLPWVEPKFVPVIVTEVPTGPELTDKLVIVGAACAPVAKKNREETARIRIDFQKCTRMIASLRGSTVGPNQTDSILAKESSPGTFIDWGKQWSRRQRSELVTTSIRAHFRRRCGTLESCRWSPLPM